MSNYPEGHDPHAPGSAGHQGHGSGHEEPRSVIPPPAPAHQQTPAAGQQHWGGVGAGHGSSGSPLKQVSLRSALRTTEFWVFVVVSVALLIAAAVSDSERALEGHGFGPQEAWKYVTALAAAFILSRGLTKFGGRDEATGRDHEHDHH